MRITWVPSILLALSVLPIHAQTIEQAIPQGRIRGVAVDEEGKPIQHAKVWPHVRHPTIGALRIAETDENGRFEIDRLEFDTFNVFAKKESEGYPDIGFAFFAEGLPSTVRLSPEQPVANVELKLGLDHTHWLSATLTIHEAQRNSGANRNGRMFKSSAFLLCPITVPPLRKCHPSKDGRGEAIICPEKSVPPDRDGKLSGEGFFVRTEGV